MFVPWYALAAHRTLEGRVWDGAVLPAFGPLFAALAPQLARLLTVWGRLRRLARGVAGLPTAVAFERLSEAVEGPFRRCLFADRPAGRFHRSPTCPTWKG